MAKKKTDEDNGERNDFGQVVFFRIRVKGVTTLLMHNVRLADPDDEYTIAISELTHKKTKTKEDREQIKRLEFEGGLYWSEQDGPYIDGMMIRKSIVEGGKELKLGSALEKCLSVQTLICSLKYDGPREPQALYADKRFVDHRMVSGQGKRGGGKTKRTRPLFAAPWEFEAGFSINSLFVSASDIPRVLAYAGNIGIGDGRSIGLGKYEATILKTS